MRKIILSISILTTLCGGISAQNVNIPDANFKAYLVNDPAINTNSDTEIQVSEAAAFTGAIDCNGLTISDLTGLETFTALTEFVFDNNNVSTIDLSQNTALVNLTIYSTGISSLDLSPNTALETISCTINPNLTSLNVSQCTNLQYLYCGDNNLSTIDVSQNNALINFWCGQNNLNTIDVSQNTALVSFQCFTNNLSSLDVSQNPLLTSLFCFGNDLVTLDMKNIDPNTLITFNATSNSNLTCIEVDDVAAANTAWTNIDATASFSTDCGYVLGVDEQTIINSLLTYPNPVQSQLTINSKENFKTVEIIDVMGKTVQSITVQNNTIDVSHLTKGIYFLQTLTGKGLVSGKFIKE